MAKDTNPVSPANTPDQGARPGGIDVDTPEMMGLVYEDLRRLAYKQLGDQARQKTLQPTALVHEVFLKMNRDAKVDEASRSHFFAIAATAMRQVLVSYYRKYATTKRGGNFKRIEFDENSMVSPHVAEDVLALEEALVKLHEIDERRAQIVEMRFYGGMTIEEVAEVIGVSSRTVKNIWASTRAWLRRELAENS